MTGVPAPTLYHRWLGWHAPAMRRAITVLIAGLIVAVVLLPFIAWGLALDGGWNASALIFLLTTWWIIIRADSSRAPQLAAREDQTEGSARVLLVGASVASLLGAGYALHLAGQKSGAPRMLLIGAAVLTVVLSWAVINTVYTLRYADQHFRFTPAASRSAPKTASNIPATATSPTSPSPSACATRYRTPPCAIRRSGARRLPTPSCPMCSASSSWQAPSTSSPDCSGNSARATAPAAGTRTLLLPVSRWLRSRGIACCHAWTGSWTGVPDNPSAPRAP